MKFLIIGLFSIQIVTAQVREAYVQNRGADNWYQVYGQGDEAILIINGGPGMNSRGFESLAKNLAKRYKMRVIIYDQRGTGNSEIKNVSSETVTIELMVDDIESIRTAEKLDSWILFGQSFGGMLASVYASKHPQRIQKLILSSSGGLSLRDLGEVNIMGRLTSNERDSFNIWNQRSSADPLNEEFLLKRNTFLASAYLVGGDHIPAVADRLGEVDRQLNSIVFSDLRRNGFDLTDDLITYEKPVLILIGDQDVVSLDAAKRTHQLLSNSQFVVVPNSGHYGWLENPKVYLEAIDAFLR